MAKRKKKTAGDKKTAVAVEPTSAESSNQSPAAAETPPALQSSTLYRILRVLLQITGAGLVLGLLAVISYFGYEYAHTNKVYAGITVANQSAGGKDFVDAAQPLLDYETTLESDGLTFTYKNTTVTLPLKSEPDAIPLVDIDTDGTVQAAFNYGRGVASWENLTDKIAALTTGNRIPLQYTIQTETITDLLSAQFDEISTPYQNAALTLSADDTLIVLPHKDGTSFHWATVLTNVENALGSLQPIEFDLALEADPAPITTALAEATLIEANSILALAPLTLTYEDKTFTIDKTELAGWLILAAAEEPAGRVASVQLDESAIRTSLDPIAAEINIPVKEGRFSLDMVDDTVQLTQFENGQDGLGVELDKTIAAITTVLLTERAQTAELVVEVTHPRATPDSLDNLGIKELLGTGETSFAGSPTNRIGNIRRGADLLNGLLVAPGETFSLLSILRPFDAANGWLPELVIKGNKLEKELGGGLCQVGSTAFRAVMMSGQEVAERRNHSWAVSYYNYNGKAGVDATIYDPSPDFKFKNTTDHYILWRTRIEGYNIYFELWGTSDGRKGYFTEPTNYGYVSPGATEEVVDESLAPGTRNCAQHAYTGVSASFDYIIDWADGTQTTKNYTSVYKAQPARCLVGPEPTVAETPAEETTAPEDTTVPIETPTDNSTNPNKNKNKNKNSAN